jgi:hemerythrin-like domain-containing protein
MRTIISGVKEHVQEEEGDVLPKMREQLSDDQLSKLTEQARTTKEELLGAARSAGPLIDLTKDKLYELAQEKHIAGRSEMTKEQLISALQKT